MTAKLSKVMLILSFLLYTTAAFGVESEGYLQVKTFSFDLKEVAMKEVLKQIEKNSKYVFMYSAEVVNSTQSINFKVENLTLTQVLDKLFKGSKVEYEIDGLQVILKIQQAKSTGNKQEKATIRGIIYDEKQKEPIIGASVMIKSSAQGTVTNLDGEFSLSCSVGDVLTISYIGFTTKEIAVTNLKLYSIELNEATATLGEVVVTAFGSSQKKASMVGSVQQVKPAELKMPSSSLSASFAGRMAGVIAVQRSGEPGADGADFWIRGKSTFSGATGALIVLDGVEIGSTELNSLDAEVIESFSILKDATATALYGTRGANGVMIVTTKSGKDLDKPIINFRIEGAMSQMTSVPKMVDGVTYMNMFNEAISRPGSGAQPYSEDKIQGTKNGLNPYLYPNVDWYDEMFKKNAFSERVNFNIRGGSKRMDYFMSASLKHSDGNLKSLSKDYFSYNNNVNVYNYDFVNNLNIKATSTTKVSLGLNLSVRDWKGPGVSVDDIFSISKEANPVDYPILFPAGKANYDCILWGDKSGGPYNGGYRNPIAEYVTSYKTEVRSTITANFKVTQELDMLLKGLRFSGLFSYKNYTTSSVNRSSSYNHFELSGYDKESMEYNIKRIGDEKGTELSTSGSHGGNRKTYLQFMLDYNHIFDEVHDINAMFLYNHEQYNTNNPSDLYSSLPKRKQGIAGRVSYAFDSRYLFEANFGYNGSENFAKGHRFGFFPSIAVGYNISQEKFWQPLSSAISNLKIRASYGLVGNDDTGAGRFAYLESLSLNGSPSFVTGVNQNTSLDGPQWARYFNPNLTWEVGEKLNIGVDLQLFYDLNINIDLFKEVRRDIFLSRDGTIPSFVGTGGAKVYSNIGKMQNKGADFSLDYNKQFTKDFFLSFKSTFTFAQNKILERDEPPFRQYPNLSSVGKSMGLNFGYISNGLFPNQEAIDNAPKQTLGYSPMPGDIWYQNMPDRNGNYDNYINGNDCVYMGMPEDPEIVYGFGPSLKYKSWDLSFFFQGVARTSLIMKGFHPFGSTSIQGVADFISKDRWTEENQNINAQYPRLSKESNSNNTAASSYWLRDASFLKLKNAEIGYTYKGMRFYVSGLNLLTFSSFKHWDPEMGDGNGLKYPTQRVFNLGFQMTIK